MMAHLLHSFDRHLEVTADVDTLGTAHRLPDRKNNGAHSRVREDRRVLGAPAY
ncbi:hypothetical protein SAMN06296378_2302 [Salinibacterium xinjiangense]|uniref:Uncharacterized protein n=1 Tax=Salinibacterium xinjiangense TaxID=386302 RepID=A0A2C8ZX90_9MICO|nr:hypothetical protein SAMN06296378_2302 [Salinibacterium xinjiangense]